MMMAKLYRIRLFVYIIRTRLVIAKQNKETARCFFQSNLTFFQVLFYYFFQNIDSTKRFVRKLRHLLNQCYGYFFYFTLTRICNSCFVWNFKLDEIL